MNQDVADRLLLDVREISLSELLNHRDGSSLDKALEQVLTVNANSNFNSFSSSI